METNPIKLVIVDDHDLVRKSWKILLENHPRFKIIGEYSNGDRAIELTRYYKPDVALVDISMSPMDGFTLTSNLLILDPTLKIIGFSVNNQPDFARRMLALGARGYLTKTSPFEEICLGIIKVSEGYIFICAEIQGSLV